MQSKFLGKLIRATLSYGVAGACLYWVFHDVHFHEVFEHFAHVSWWWIPGVVLCELLVYVVAGWEWQILLRPAGRISVARTTQAIFAGRFANDILPVHIGYVVRVYLVSRWTNAGIVSVAPSLLVERLLDGFWLALGLGMTAMTFRLPQKVARTAEVWAAIMAAGLTAAVIIIFRESRPGSERGGFSRKWSQKLREGLVHVLDQLRAIGRSWLVAAGVGLSFLKFAMLCFAFLALLRAYGINLPLVSELAVFCIAYAGISLPSTPASAGVFQLFCVAGLELFHTPKAVAAGFALLAFTIFTAPLSLIGFLALAQTGLSLHEIRSKAGRFGLDQTTQEKH